MRTVMRTVWTVLLVTGICCCQTTPAASGNATGPAAASSALTSIGCWQANVVADPDAITIPAGTRIPLGLKQAISTKNAREGDPVYAETTFPFVMNERVAAPSWHLVFRARLRASSAGGTGLKAGRKF